MFESVGLPKNVQQHIDSVLAHKDISIDWYTFQKPSTQGFMSVTAFIQSSAGPLVIHYTPEPLQEQRRINMAEKIAGISRHLTERMPDLPVQKTVAAEMIGDGSYYFVQEYLEGERLGTRDMKNGHIIDTYTVPKKDIEGLQYRIDQYTAALHDHPMPGFGFLVMDNGTLQGECKSWKAFLEEGSARWVQELYDTTSNTECTQQIKKLENGIATLLEREPGYTQLSQGHFVHGDLVNLSNILVKDGDVTGIIDFEWSLSGDPTWEFSHTEIRPSGQYFASRGMDNTDERNAFLRRVDFNTIFWSLWGAHVHTRINKYGLKELLLNRAELYLAKFN